MYNDKHTFAYRPFITVLIFTIELLKIIYTCLLYSCIPYVLDVFSLIVNHSAPRGKTDREPHMLLLHLNKHENFRAEVKKKKSMIERKYNNFHTPLCTLYGNGNCWVGHLKFSTDCESTQPIPH